MWKSPRRADAARLFAVKKNVRKDCAFHRGLRQKNNHIPLFHFPQPFVEGQPYIMLLFVVMFEVMSRMISAILGSRCIMSSTLRMELSTVA